MRKFTYMRIDISDLYVNPDNYRYVEGVQDEISAIIAMFNVNVGDSRREMINLAKDIIEDGLNPFEMPIVSYDDVLKKYIVYDGNRRITCLKLMTQYKGNDIILKQLPTVAELYKLTYSGETKIQCVVYEDADDAIHFLNKIHNDINDGIGRKPWDSQAKMNANAASGNRSRAYAVVEFLKTNKNTDEELLDMIKTNRWVSKLDRVVGFALFKEKYNIQFDSNNNMSYLDTEEQVLKMLSKLVYDIITNSATGNFRMKADFQKYVDNLPDEFKSQVKTENLETVKLAEKKEGKVSETVEDKNDTGKGTSQETKVDSSKQNDGTGIPKNIPRKYVYSRAALVLGKNYSEKDYECLNEKGQQFLMELESLNVKEHPSASVTLCRCVLEYVIKLWMSEMGGTFDSSKLPSSYTGCVNLLRKNNIIDNKEHSILTALVNKEEYITLLNTWMHADTDACVSETPLVSGWKNARLLIEKYIDTHKDN